MKNSNPDCDVGQAGLDIAFGEIVEGDDLGEDAVVVLVLLAAVVERFIVLPLQLGFTHAEPGKGCVRRVLRLLERITALRRGRVARCGESRLGLLDVRPCGVRLLEHST
jgi:hypothetical protein